MRYLLPSVLLLAAAMSSAQNCDNLIALSKVSTVVTSDKESVTQHAENFCNEYRRSQSSASSMAAGASFKFLAATFASGNASADEVASRYCSASSGYSAHKDAYRQYVETIAPEAYQAVDTCMKLQADVSYNLASHTAKEFKVITTFRNSRQDPRPARLEAHPTKGITCDWSKSGKPEIELSSATTKVLECSREDYRSDGSVTVVWANASVPGANLVLPWPATDAPVSSLRALQVKVAALDRGQTDISTSAPHTFTADITRANSVFVPGSTLETFIETGSLKPATASLMFRSGELNQAQLVLRPKTRDGKLGICVGLNTSPGEAGGSGAFLWRLAISQAGTNLATASPTRVQCESLTP